MSQKKSHLVATLNMSMNISAFTCAVCILLCVVCWKMSVIAQLSVLYHLFICSCSCYVFKSGQHFCWLVYERVTPIMTAALPAAWQMVQERWEQGVGWGVVIYLPIALLPAPVLFSEAYLWIIKTHQNLVVCQPCCWCRKQTVSPRDCVTDAVFRTETHVLIWSVLVDSQQLFFCVLQMCF